MCFFSETKLAGKIREEYLEDPNSIGRTDLSSFLYT
jgi:hypothetical protein